MKKQFINLFFLLFLSFFPFFTSPIEATGSGVLHIECSMKDVEVYINYILEGTASPIFKKTGMIPGEIVNITLKKANYNDLSFKVEIQEGLNKFENLTLKPAFGFLTIQGDPAEAEVFIDDKLIGHLPEVEKYKIGSGKHMLTVRKAGYKSIINKIVKIFDEESSVEKVSLVKGEEISEEAINSTNKDQLEDEREKTIDTQPDIKSEKKVKQQEKSMPSKLSSPEKKGEQKKEGVATPLRLGPAKPLRPGSSKPRSSIQEEVTPKKEMNSPSTDQEKKSDEEVPSPAVPGMVNNTILKTPKLESGNLAAVNEKEVLDNEKKTELSEITPVKEIPIASADKNPLKSEAVVSEPITKPEPLVPKDLEVLVSKKKPALEESSQPPDDKHTTVTTNTSKSLNSPALIEKQSNGEKEQINLLPAKNESQQEVVKSDSPHKIEVVIKKRLADEVQFLNTPKTLTIKTGELVEWINKDNRAHFISYKPKFTMFASYGKESEDEDENIAATKTDISSKSGQDGAKTFNSPKLDEGSSWDYNFLEKGSFDYYCFIHPLEIAGTIIVE